MNKTCHECLWSDSVDAELHCTQDEVVATHPYLKGGIPTILERRKEEGACGTRGRLWQMFTEGAT